MRTAFFQVAIVVVVVACLCTIVFLQQLQIESLNNIIDNDANEYYKIKEARYLLVIKRDGGEYGPYGRGILRVSKSGDTLYFFPVDSLGTSLWADTDGLKDSSAPGGASK